MVRKKTSKKQVFSFADMQITKIHDKKGITRWKPEDTFLHSDKVGAALLECLIDNDIETFIEILDSFLRVNRLQVAHGELDVI